jgi:hypothetical protein
MQFAIGVTFLECSFVKHRHGPLGVKGGIGKVMLLLHQKPRAYHFGIKIIAVCLVSL